MFGSGPLPLPTCVRFALRVRCLLSSATVARSTVPSLADEEREALMRVEQSQLEWEALVQASSTIKSALDGDGGGNDGDGNDGGDDDDDDGRSVACRRAMNSGRLLQHRRSRRRVHNCV